MFKDKFLNLFFLSITSGVLMWLAWPPIGIFPFIFIAFSVIFILEEIIGRRKQSATNRSLFLYSYLFFLVWNVLTTWWIVYSTFAGAIAANLLNSLIMTIPVLIFHSVKKRTTPATGYLTFIAAWISYEFLHHQWELTWPWLSLGNAFGQWPFLVQWYEFTGIFGGTLWVLVLNLLFFLWLKEKFLNFKKMHKPLLKVRYRLPSPIVSFVLVILSPSIISIIQYVTHADEGTPFDIVVVQPNIDPYGTKFDLTTVDLQLERMLHLADSLADENTKYIVLPETALPRGVWLNNIENDNHVNWIYTFLQKYPDVHFVTGISAYELYEDAESPPTSTARQFRSGKCCYDAFNSAIQLDMTGELQVYHKSKLVPGVERMPYPSLFRFLEPYAINLGGISGSLGTQKERGVFFTSDSIGIAPVICYESVYGEYTTEYIKSGANAIFVVTNDGWWDDTPGYKQHLYFSSLRAIENRKSVARSANTGVSCFINQRGDIQQATPFWEPAVIRQEILFNDKKTFYIRFGDYIARVALLVTILALLFAFVKNKTNPAKLIPKRNGK